MGKTICDCAVKLTEIEDGYSLEVKGSEVKERLGCCLGFMKEWIERCCKGEKPSAKESTDCCS
jgi:hypothetical protein